MNQRVHPSDLELAALLSSKICHDALNPVGAIQNGLQLLDEDNVGDAHKYAMDMIRNVTAQVSARLQFARFAFGAAGSAGAQIEMSMAEKLANEFVGHGKHKLVWHGQPGYMAKDKAKLLLNLVAAAIAALPRGGEIDAAISGSYDNPSFAVRCRGTSARPPQYFTELLAGDTVNVDALSIQPYFTCRLADVSNMSLEIMRDGADVLLLARPK